MATQGPILEVDVVTFAIRNDRLEVLLVRRTNPPLTGEWALPGARLKPRESLADCARHALVERTGLDIAYLEQLYTFDDLRPDQLRDARGPTISVAYFALLPLRAATEAQPGRAVEVAQWWPADSPPRLAFDHGRILQAALERVAAKVDYAPIPFSVLPDEFTMRELRVVHEALTNSPVTHENNFWRLMANRWGLEPTGRYRGGQGRPAALYRLPSKRPCSAANDNQA